MFNLFRNAAGQPGSLTAGLLALLEHCDRELLNGLLRLAGIEHQVEPGAEVSVQFPAPGGPLTSGLIATPQFRLGLATQAPGEPFEPGDLAGLPRPLLAISLTGAAPPDGHGLTWEQVDRWLAGTAEQFDPDSRTGFLVRQFRTLLADLGIQYFAGFDAGLLADASGALATVGRFYQTAGQFFDRFGPALGALREGAVPLRQASAQELLAGYCYRDYADPNLGPGGFLRCAFHLPDGQLQLAAWLAPGSDALARMQEQLREEHSFLDRLQGLEQAPLLWLWSTAGERRLPLDETNPEQLAELELTQYTTAVQIAMPFADLPGDNLAGRVLGRLQTLLEALAPVLSAVVH